jgi:LPS export ABC transporter protein LptC
VSNVISQYKTQVPLSMLVGIFVLIGCENDINEVNRLTRHETLPVQTIIQSQIKYTDSTILQFTVDAGKIDRYPNGEDPRDEFTDGVEVVTYSENGDFESQINAERATNFTKRELMVAENKVVLRNYEGKMLETEQLMWDDKSDRIYTHQFVKITTPTEILFGDGLEAKPDFSEFEIQNIKGRIKVDTEESDSTSINKESQIK